jgi:hypothetical protein
MPVFGRSSAPQFGNLLAGAKSLREATSSSTFQNCNPEKVAVMCACLLSVLQNDGRIRRDRSRVAFVLTVLRGLLRRLHVAHRSCLVAAQWSRGQANAFSSDDGCQKHQPVIFPLILSRAEG